MSLKRSSFQIAVDVLAAINNGEMRPTRIMYAANLTWPSLQKTLNLLVSKKYVVEVSENPTYSKKQYKITKSGRNVLSYYSKLEKLVKINAHT